ncbi:MAG: Gfo/Idh/MocA family oxidoreductase [Candidatus Obscuribacterales bacterium]|nr:Gfo/Idh/MocA family oxidoreductase [Candidatus Obscuribacterales bacterium]
MESAKVAVIGVGNWGKNLVRNFANLGALSMVCDLDSNRLATVEKDFPSVRVTNSLDAVLKDTEVKAVVVATPSDSHFPVAKQALLAGKHVYVEKPLARDVRHAEELDQLATERNLILMVGHLLLYHPAVNLLKDLIASGELGELRFIRSDRMNFNPNRRDHWSVLWDLAPHDISMMAYLLDCQDVEADRVGGWDADGHGVIDVAYLDLEFNTKGRVIPGQVRNSWIDPQKLVRLTVNGSLKTAVLNDHQADNKLALHSLTPAGRMVVEYPEYSDMEPLHLECEHFLKCVSTGQRPRTDANNAYAVLRVLSDVEERLSRRPAVKAAAAAAANS